MDRRNRSNLAFGVILILVGAWFLGQQLFPGFVLFQSFSWPMIVIGVGGLLLLLALLNRQPDMAVPAVVVGGIGGLLYYQNLSGNWGSWGYAWTLIPGFAGLGNLLAALLGENPRHSAREGLRMIFVSALLFVIFYSLLGGPSWLSLYWPVLVIGLGVYMLARSFLRR